MDTPRRPAHDGELPDAIDPLLPGRPLTDLVNTHGDGGHSFDPMVVADVCVRAAPEAAATVEPESPGEPAARARPATDRTGAQRHAHLLHVRGGIRAANAAGRSWQQACMEIDLGRFASLPDAERVVVTTYAEYRALGDTSPVVTPAELFSVMARWEQGRSSSGPSRAR